MWPLQEKREKNVKSKASMRFFLFLFIFICYYYSSLSLLYSVVFICNMELGQSTWFPLEENGFNSDALKQDPSIPSQHGRPEPIRDATVRSCYLWPLTRLPACCWHGHEWESGRALCPGMTQTQSYALGTESACLMERGQSAAWVQEAWEPVEAQETQHDRRTWHMYTGRKTQRYAHTYGYFHQ